MSVFFTNLFRTALIANQTIMNSANVRAVLFREAPVFETGDTRYTTVEVTADLLAKPGWVEAAGTGYPFSHNLPVTVRSESDNRYVIFSQYPFTGLDAAEVEAVGFQYIGSLGGKTNPLIMVSTTPFPLKTVVHGGDGVTASPDAGLVGVSNRWLFSWSVPAGGTITLVEGPLALARGAPTFEASHTQHVWLYPQRANMLANPSFEAAGTNFWSTNRAIARVADPAPTGGAWAGKITGASPLIVESNIFPTSRSEQWTVQLMAKGVGTLKVGFVWWDDDFEEVAVDWGQNESWVLNANTFVHIVTCRMPVQTYQGMLRLEVSGGTTLTIDQCLCESGFLKDWNYFDGGTTYGARDDYSWYGGANRQGASYSFWYNNRRAIYGRLFARNIDDDVLVTDEVMGEQGLIYKWVPAGTIIQPHIDVLYPNDLQAPVPPKPASVLPYRAVGNYFTDLGGVINPWVTYPESL